MRSAGSGIISSNGTSGQQRSGNDQNPDVPGQWSGDGGKVRGRTADLSAPSSLSGCRILPVQLGLVTPEEVEIVKGIDEGARVVTNPSEAGIK